MLIEDTPATGEDAPPLDVVTVAGARGERNQLDMPRAVAIVETMAALVLADFALRQSARIPAKGK